MGIGDPIVVEVELYRTRHDNKRVVKERNIKAVKCIYLGDTTLQEGTVHGGYYEREGSYYEPPYLKVTNTVPVSVVQRVPKVGKRFLKPFYIHRIKHDNHTEERCTDNHE